MYKKAVLYRLVPMCEIQVDFDKYGKEKGTGTMSAIFFDTNRAQYEKICVNGSEYYVFSGKEK